MQISQQDVVRGDAHVRNSTSIQHTQGGGAAAKIVAAIVQIFTRMRNGMNQSATASRVVDYDSSVGVSTIAVCCTADAGDTTATFLKFTEFADMPLFGTG